MSNRAADGVDADDPLRVGPDRTDAGAAMSGDAGGPIRANAGAPIGDDTVGTRGAPPPCPPPLPPTGPASFAVPEGACDCHAHVFGAPPRYPYREPRRYTPADGSDVQHYARMLRALGLRRAVLVQPTLYHDNRLTLDGMRALRQAGIDTRGIALVDECASDEELAALHDAGIRGVRAHLRGGPEGRPGDDAPLADRLHALDRLAERIAPMGWHLQVHIAGDMLDGLANWLSGLPIAVVLDHFARVRLSAGTADAGARRLIDVLQGGACWLKLSAPNRFDAPLPPYPALAPFVRDLVAAAPDRMLWGSDWPHSSFHGAMPSDAELLNALALWIPDADTRRRVLVDNPARLYGFAPPFTKTTRESP